MPPLKVLTLKMKGSRIVIGLTNLRQILEVNEEMGRISYEAESPDEAAFVIAARELGFESYKRTHKHLTA